MAWLVCLPCLAPAAIAQPGRTAARVVWTQGDRVYIAAPDSSITAPGTHLGFHYRGRRVAEGEVTGIHENEFMFARITWGSLAGAKQLGGIRISVLPSASAAPSVFRLGYPAASRSCLWFACGSLSLRQPSGVSYRVDEYLPGRSHRLVREPALTSPLRGGTQHPQLPEPSPPWPDTLVIRYFDDVSDEEIALERGDLEAAVFWPGEASSHIRQAVGWSGYPPGGRARSFVHAVGRTQGAPDLSTLLDETARSRLAEMNTEIFRGDLVECSAPAAVVLRADSIPALRQGGIRFEVDRAAPGRQVIERFLNRPGGRARPPDEGSIIRLIHGTTDLVESTGPDLCLFEVRSPVFCAPTFRDYVKRLGADALANLIECQPPDEKP